MDTVTADCVEFIQASSINIENQADRPMFDSDSALIGVDNQCKSCISPFLSDFVEPSVPVSTKLVGLGGKETTGLQFGTLKWTWEDDQGCKNNHIFPSSYYAPTATLCLLNPQHWIQTMSQEGS
jgi:hypothetical protein